MYVDLYGLAVDCPFSNPIENCPVIELRKVTNLLNRYEIIKNMTQERQNEYVIHHNFCRMKRENMEIKCKNSK